MTHSPSSAPLVGALALLALSSSPLTAQEPAQPTAGDLEVYALAVDSAAFPDESSVLLLQERTLRVEEDGTWSVGLRMVRQILTDRAVAPSGELSFGYDPTREELSLDWARVVESDGTVVSAEPVHAQELDQPVSRTAPVYSSVKQLRATLGDVTVGRIVDWKYTHRTTNPPLPGDIYLGWSANSSTPLRRTRLVIDAPASFALRIEEENLDGPTDVREEGGRVIRTWAFEDVEPVEPEPFAATPNDVVRRVVVSADLGWDDIAAWYAGLAADRDVVTPALEERVAGVVAGATTLTDSLKAVHKWIAQDVRYASISLGLGGYQPRPADEVLSTGVGDCKDKTTLFLAVARHMGVEAFPVIVRNSGRVDTDHRTIRQFNHMVAAIRPEGEWVYLDLTVPVSPYGHVYGGLQGDKGVMLRDDGTAEVVDFPEDPATANRSAIFVSGTIDTDGSFEGTYTEQVRGNLQYRLRAEFARSLTEERRSGVARNLATRVSRTATTDSTELFDGRDLDAEPRLWAHVTSDSILEPVPGGHMLRLPLPPYGSPEAIARLEEDSVRTFPINAGGVFGRKEHLTEIRYTLPEGWTVDLPESVRAESAFGFYETEYRQDGRELFIRRVMRGNDDVLPADRMPELIDWLKAQSGDRIDHVVLRPPGG